MQKPTCYRCLNVILFFLQSDFEYVNGKFTWIPAPPAKRPLFFFRKRYKQFFFIIFHVFGRYKKVLSPNKKYLVAFRIEYVHLRTTVRLKGQKKFI